MRRFPGSGWPCAVALMCCVVSSCGSKTTEAPKQRTTAELIVDLESGTRPVRESAALALGAARAPEAVPALIRAFDHRELNLIPIAQALGKIGDPAAVQPMLDVMREGGHTDKEMRALQNGLVEIGQPAIPALLVALDDTRLRVPAAEILSTMGSVAVDPLIQKFHESSGTVTGLAAARALAEMQDPRAAAEITAALKASENQSRLRRSDLVAAVYRFVVRAGQPGSETHLIEALDDVGRLAMANDFAASGNPKLKAAAEAWATRRKVLLEGKSDLAWGVNPVSDSQLALFHFDGALATSQGVAPSEARNISFAAGRFGQAVSVGEGGMLSYPIAGLIDFAEGTVEMWVSPQVDGTDPIYAKYNHILLLYQPSGADQFLISEGTFRGFYAGSVLGGKYTGAGGGDISPWKVGRWYHVAFTFSRAKSRQELFVDGQLVSWGTEQIPEIVLGGTTFTLGCDTYGKWTRFLMDEVRISKEALSGQSINADAVRGSPFADNEVFKSSLGRF